MRRAAGIWLRLMTGVCGASLLRADAMVNDPASGVPRRRGARNASGGNEFQRRDYSSCNQAILYWPPRARR